MDETFPGECAEGAELLVAKLRSVVNRRFQGEVPKPEMVMVDRGRGFYNLGNWQHHPTVPERVARARFQERDGQQRIDMSVHTNG